MKKRGRIIISLVVFATILLTLSGTVQAAPAQWVKRYNGPANSYDDARAIAVDGSGNVYVAGVSTGNGTRYDYAIIKYNSNGVQQWMKRYNGPGNSDDEAQAIAVDGSGNVYVTGYSTGHSTYRDYTTIKYNSDGVRQWVKRYNGPSNSYDYGNAIAVDGFGNVYVTGYSMGSGTSYDYATIKYNSDGVRQWVKRYNGPSNSYDYGNAIAVDGSGNVYVTGFSWGSGTYDDYVTIKYNSNGVRQWVKRYNGPGNYIDSVEAIAVDGSGNVYVTGYSMGSGTGLDYATIKYNSDGVRQWVKRYNGPGNGADWAEAIAVDGLGNVYVTGYSWGSGISYDYATIKYNSNGVRQWVRRYNGPGNGRDDAKAIAVDGSGNVYVAGVSTGNDTYDDYATIKYDSSGVRQWVKRYNGLSNREDLARAIAIDGSGNVYVTGYSVGSGTGEDYATIKYESSGVRQWVKRYNGPGNSCDDAKAIAVDGSGNIYVTGESGGSGTSREDYVTIKYNSSGVREWMKKYNGPGNDIDRAQAIAVDSAGNVYVTGSSLVSGQSLDYATIKYDTNGVREWVKRYNGPGNSYDDARAIAVDGSDNVYVTGVSTGNGTGYDYATIKYSNDGVRQWVKRYNGPGNSEDEAQAIAVDDSGNVYVTGYSESSGTGCDYATIKYNSSGVRQWVKRYNGPGNSYDEAEAIAVDGSGNVYVTGYSEGSGTNRDYTTIKYNSDGVQQWVKRYNGPGNSVDSAEAIAVDGSGDVYVTGYSGGSTYSDYATIKYNSDGVRQWVKRYNGPGNSYDYAEAIAVDGSGNVYVTGESGGLGTCYDCATIKYNSNGVRQWVKRYNGPGNSDDNAEAIAVDGSGNVYVTGYSTGNGTGYDYVTIKYYATIQ